MLVARCGQAACTWARPVSGASASFLRARPLPAPLQSIAALHSTAPRNFGLEEFYDTKNRTLANEDMVFGRAWEASELRRKSFDDLHKLWFVLYKERNVLKTEHARARRNLMRIRCPDRKKAVRKSMGRIKLVLSERREAYRDSAKQLRVDAAKKRIAEESAQSDATV